MTTTEGTRAWVQTAIESGVDTGQGVDVMGADVILLDLRGFELGERAVALRSGLPVLHAWGYAEEALKPPGMEVSSIDPLAGPICPNDLGGSCVGAGRGGSDVASARPGWLIWDR